MTLPATELLTERMYRRVEMEAMEAQTKDEYVDEDDEKEDDNNVTESHAVLPSNTSPP